MPFQSNASPCYSTTPYILSTINNEILNRHTLPQTHNTQTEKESVNAEIVKQKWKATKGKTSIKQTKETKGKLEKFWIATNNIGMKYWPSIIPVKYLKLRCLHAVPKCFSFIITLIFICILSHLLGQSDEIPKTDHLCQDLELLNWPIF